jgi:pilus assembly protein CpaB
MKVQIMVLAVLGVVAALSVALLLGTSSARKTAPKEAAEVSVIIAAKTLAPMTKIEAECITTKVVPRAQAPAGSFADDVLVVGQVLIVPMVQGQAFTKACFAPEGSGFHLAANLPKGMRAVSIGMSESSGLDGLLYPGCCVDVIASFDVKKKDGGQGIISKTMLQGVQVLAVDNRTVVSQGDDKAPSGKGNEKKRVTLLVDDKQAQMVQLATRHGTVTLAMRNPTDIESSAEPRITKLSELGVPGLEESLTAAEEPSVAAAEPAPTPVSPPVAPAPPPAAPVAQAQAPVEVSMQPAPIVEPPQWIIMLIRGGESVAKSFPLPKTSPSAP